jgi:hypothetical protein
MGVPAESKTEAASYIDNLLSGLSGCVFDLLAHQIDDFLHNGIEDFSQIRTIRSQGSISKLKRS